MKAILQSDFSQSSIDKDARIIRGVRVIENNRDVTYKGADGKPKSFRTNDGLLTGLLSHAGESIPSHISHAWSDGNGEPLNDRCGALKNFRMTEGALLADFHAMPGVNGDKAIWLAENDPKNAALSAIFDYNAISSEGVTYAVPLNFQAADLVAKGAACSALLSQFKTEETDMTEEAVNKLVSDAVTAALKNYKPEGYITEAESDKRITAALAAYKPEKAKLSDEDKAAIVTEAEAALVAKLGGGPLLMNFKKENDAQSQFTAMLAEYRKTSPNEGTAIARLLRDHPEMTPQREAHLQAEIARLNAAA